jgi:hypothetical protein
MKIRLKQQTPECVGIHPDLDFVIDKYYCKSIRSGKLIILDQREVGTEWIERKNHE